MITITIILAALAAIMAVLGAYMKSIEVWQKQAFIVIGIVMIVLIVIQAIMNDRNLRICYAKIDRMNGSLENMQGQLTTFRELGARLSNTFYGSPSTTFSRNT